MNEDTQIHRWSNGEVRYLRDGPVCRDLWMQQFARPKVLAHLLLVLCPFHPPCNMHVCICGGSTHLWVSIYVPMPTRVCPVLWTAHLF